MESQQLTEWRLLMIDDDEDDYLITREMLAQQEDRKIRVDWASTYRDGMQRASSGNYDAILIDYDLDKSGSGITLIRELTSDGIDAPLILYTGRGREAVEVEGMEAGATIYLTKGEVNVQTLERFIRYAIERKQIERKLANSERRFRELIKHAPSAMYEIDFRTRRFTSVNDAMVMLSGYSREELLEMDATSMMDEEGMRLFQQRIQSWLAGEKPDEMVEYRIRHKDGHTIFAVLTVTFTTDDNGRPIGALVVGHDVTQRLRIEDQLSKTSQDLAKAHGDLITETNRLQAVLQALPVGMAIFDALGARMQYNRAFEQVWGSDTLPPVNTEKDFGAYQAWWVDTGEPVKAEEWAAARAIASGEPVIGQYLRIQKFDGTQGYVLNSAAPVRDYMGRIVGYVVAIMDITDRKLAEDALEQSLDRERAHIREMEALMDTVPAMIWISRDPQCHEMVGNRYGYEFLGMGQGQNLSKTAPEEELTAQRYSNYKDGKELPGEDMPMQVAAATGQAFSNYDFDMVFDDGSFCTVLGNVSPLFDEAGQPAGAVGAFIDITKQREVERQLKRIAEELESSNQALREFASIASHDLQEPLRKVQAFGNMLEKHCKDQIDAEGRNYIHRMISAADRMSQMIQRLLDYSRLTSQPHPFEPVDLNEVANEVLYDLEIRLSESGGRVSVGELPTIQADPLQMRQLFQNLISNALKYCDPERTPEIRVESVPISYERVEITVEDNGIGFDMRYAGRIFDPFVRLQGRASEQEGTGMGLTICKKVVERHGGEIAVESTPGVGSKFTIVLPVRR